MEDKGTPELPEASLSGWAYNQPMKSETDTLELSAFTRTMRGLLAVSKDELNEKMDAYNRNKKRRKAKRDSSRAPNARH